MTLCGDSTARDAEVRVWGLHNRHVAAAAAVVANAA